MNSLGNSTQSSLIGLCKVVKRSHQAIKLFRGILQCYVEITVLAMFYQTDFDHIGVTGSIQSRINVTPNYLAHRMGYKTRCQL